MESLKQNMPENSSPVLINTITIKDYFSIKNEKLAHLANQKEIYFLGENGVGKTILMQAILLSLRKSEKKQLISLGLSPDFDDKIFAETINIQKNSIVHFDSYPNIFAYGVGRLRTHDNEVDTTGYGTLFDKQKVNLTNPVEWLKEVERLQLKGMGSLKLNEVIAMLTDILNIENKKEIVIEQKGADFIFKEQNTIVKFAELADGYRSVLLILADLLKRLSENQPDITDICDFKGCVLIDEIDMLLHPKWEYTIVKKLREKLPNIQWFFSTHSPVLVLGASTDAIFYRIFKEQGETKISQPYTFADIGNLRSNGIITSPLFGLEYAGMREQLENTLSEIETSETWLIGKIHKQILEKYREEKQKKSASYIPDETINKWIKEALNEEVADAKRE